MNASAPGTGKAHPPSQRLRYCPTAHPLQSSSLPLQNWSRNWEKKQGRSLAGRDAAHSIYLQGPTNCKGHVPLENLWLLKLRLWSHTKQGHMKKSNPSPTHRQDSTPGLPPETNHLLKNNQGRRTPAVANVYSVWLNWNTLGQILSNVMYRYWDCNIWPEHTKVKSWSWPKWGIILCRALVIRSEVGQLSKQERKRATDWAAGWRNTRHCRLWAVFIMQHNQSTGFQRSSYHFR